MSVKAAGGVIARKFKVDITSDVLCPFCLIGTKQLILAIDQYNADHTSSPLDVDIRLLPYQLNPGMSETPITRAEMYAKKFGAQRAESLKEGMIARFAALGYKTELGGNTSSSHLAHRLQTYALLQYPEKQLSLAMDIFELYHIHGVHPADKPSLASLAVKHGVFENTEEATEWLDGDECEKEVEAGYGIARRMGITGVPFFVFEGKYAASGAMGVEEFVHLLEEITKRETEDNLTPSPTSTAVSPPGGELGRTKITA